MILIESNMNKRNKFYLKNLKPNTNENKYILAF